MKYPTIASVKVLENYRLLIKFSSNEERIYDMTSWLEKPAFASLKSYQVFKNITIEKGGYAVSWNEELDLSEYELWKNSTPL